jgi:hypothetical protein
MADGINAIGNLQGKVDANNQLLVALGSGSTLPNDIDVDAGTGTADAGVGGTLTISTTQAATGANTTETDLWTYSLPANTLSANNYGVRITAWGSPAANANNKIVRLYFGGTVVTSGSSTSGSNGWRMVAEVLRTGAATQVALGQTLQSSAAAATAPVTPAEDTTGAITVKMTGQNGTANAGDIVFRGAIVEFLRAGS